MSNDTYGPAETGNGKHLYFVAKTVLNRRGYDHDIPSLKELADSYEYNQKKILRKIKWYKVGGYILLITIPIFSTLLAIAANKGEDAPQLSKWIYDATPYLSLLLVVLTVLNTAFKPESRFTVCCGVGLDLFHWRLEFLAGLELLEPLDNKILVTYLEQARKKLRKIQEADIKLALPEQA
ncbi:hypothetical protein [uncultured Desulfobacter sp.]|uniref:hypothetical protein n=1 Tax=uncultured Desulfobacter sp. TaxID=240139 RepID=UPI0029C842E3|nr:hypothetical protein [uncultured Desulfobacter sp.]